VLPGECVGVQRLDLLQVRDLEVAAAEVLDGAAQVGEGGELAAGLDQGQGGVQGACDWVWVCGCVLVFVIVLLG